MKVISNVLFGALSLDVYEENGDFYMTRRQINDALEYKDEKGVHKVIQRNKEIIGEGLTRSLLIPQTEDLPLVRETELFSFNQIFHILRFSKQPKANLFMDFTSLTMKALIEGKAELTFAKEEDKLDFVLQTKNLIAQCRLYGISKTEANILLQSAKVSNEDPDILIYNKLLDMQKKEIQMKRDRIYFKVRYIAQQMMDPQRSEEQNKDKYVEAWHELSDRLKFIVGIDMKAIRSGYKKKEETPPSYLDLIQKHDLFAEAEKCLSKMLATI